MKRLSLLLLISSMVLVSCELLGLTSASDAVASDTSSLEIGYRTPDKSYSVTQDLKLSKSGRKGSSISWESSRPEIITNQGIVTCPYGDDAAVTLTATISKADVSVTKEFNLTVKAIPVTVGETGPAGGIVFYDKGFYSDGWRFLEAAPAGWYDNGGDDPSIVWGGFGTEVGGTGEVIGTGKDNTVSIITALGTGTDSAAKACSDYSVTIDGKVFDDWFLPSRDELDLMYNELHDKGLGGFNVVGFFFWTSSEFDANNAYLQRFSDGHSNKATKDNSNNVRPIRAF